MQQNLIVYPAGCYGTFIEWLCNYIEANNDDLPFINDGSSHKFRGVLLDPRELLHKHIASGEKCRFSRLHPGVFGIPNSNNHVYIDSYDNIVQKDLTFLKQHFDKILVLAPDDKSMLWMDNNALEKVFLPESLFLTRRESWGYTRDFLGHIMTRDPVEKITRWLNCVIQDSASPFRLENIQAWGKSSIYDFDIWELRELLSLYWFTTHVGQLQAWQKSKLNNPEILHIELDELRSNFFQAVNRIFKHFDLTPDADRLSKLKDIHSQWLLIQHQIHKDQLCIDIADAIANNKLLDWSTAELTIIDEAFIQKRLADKGVQIKCFELNVFPTNSQDFQILLER
jgi:hypothetical protein